MLNKKKIIIAKIDTKGDVYK